MLGKAGRSGVLLLLVALTIGCDRVTKHIAAETLAGAPAQSFLADTLRLTYAENRGGFLSLGADMPAALRTAVFSVVTAVILLALAVWAWRHRSRTWHTVAVALFIAGGASNWLDRVRDGHVVDFLNLGIGWLRTGVFNVADVAIMLGAALFVIAEIRSAAERR